MSIQVPIYIIYIGYNHSLLIYGVQVKCKYILHTYRTFHNIELNLIKLLNYIEYKIIIILL